MEDQAIHNDNRLRRLITDVIVSNTKLINVKGFMGSKYIVYAFKIITPYKSWFIKKRYSQIKVLIDYIQIKYPNLKFPPFPPKRLMSTSEETIIERKKNFHKIFRYIIENVDILTEKLIIEFFALEKIMLVTFIKSYLMVNEDIYFEFSDSSGSFGSSANSLLSGNSDDKILGIRKNLAQNKIKNPNNNNVNNNIEINNNKINIINNYIDENFDTNPKKLSKRKLLSVDNYFKTFEEYKLYTGKYTCRSQATFFIIKEFLRNLEIWNNVHIFEIINEFTEYMKYKNKWKKLNPKELNSLFIGLEYEDLSEDYYKCFIPEKNYSKRNASVILENSSVSTNPSSLTETMSTNSLIYSKIKDSETEMIKLHGVLYYIGNFETNYLGAKSCLYFLNKLFDSSFNPEVEFYKAAFKKLDSKYIIQMNIDKFYKFNNYNNKKICFNIIKSYVEGYNYTKQVKILEKINFAEEIPEILNKEEFLE